MKFLRNNKFLRNFLMFLAVIGPGIITANVDNDAGGITTYSVAGASFGYMLLWVFIPMTIALVVVQEMSARMGAVTGKGLADLIRENYGVKITLFVMIGLFLADLGNTVSEFAGVAASMEVFGVSKYIAVPIGAYLIWWTVMRGSYRMVERVFLVASALYLTYVVSGFMANPPWGEVTKELFTPHFSFESGYLTMLIGLIGTTIAPWMQFYIQSSVVEKGIAIEEYKFSRLDVIIGCFMTDFVAIFIVVACAATMYANNIHIETAQDAAIALEPLAGKWASMLFAFGLLNASIFSAAILPLATSYYICESLGFEAGIDRSWKEAPVFYWIYTILIVLGAAIILIPDIPLVQVMLWSQVINGMLLPFILIFMLQLINNKALMGIYVNSKSFNLIAFLTTVVMVGLTIMLVVTSVFPSLLGT